MTVPVLTQWVANAVVVLFFPLAFHQIGKGITFAFLAAMSLAQGLFAWFFLPETKNRPLEEIEAFWRTRGASAAAWRSGGTDRHQSQARLRESAAE